MSPVRTILHPTDLSENSEYAFRLACSLARDYGARLIVAHVVEPPIYVSYGELEKILQHPLGYTLELEAKLAKHRALDPKIPMEHHLLEGNAVDEILNLAEETQSDLIVMATHGRKGLSRLLMGSVAEKIVRKAPCPVLTVKIPAPNRVTSSESTSTAGEKTLSSGPT
jgi:nucleotide-binding universal stress UspA family protein